MCTLHVLGRHAAVLDGDACNCNPSAAMTFMMTQTLDCLPQRAPCRGSRDLALHRGQSGSCPRRAGRNRSGILARNQPSVPTRHRPQAWHRRRCRETGAGCGCRCGRGRLGLAVQKTIWRRLQSAGSGLCLTVSHGKHFRQARLRAACEFESPVGEKSGFWCRTK